MTRIAIAEAPRAEQVVRHLGGERGAAMLTSVMPTSRVTRRSCGSRRTRTRRAWPGDSSGSRCALPRRVSEK